MTKLSRILMGLTRKRAKADPPPEFRPCRFEWGGYSEELLRELLGDEEKKQDDW